RYEFIPVQSMKKAMDVIVKIVEIVNHERNTIYKKTLGFGS
ncbi:Peptidase T, partial [termite gut metagenome]